MTITPEKTVVVPEKTVEVPTHVPGPTEKALIEGLEIFGPNGEFWQRGTLLLESRYCAIGAAAQAAGDLDSAIHDMFDSEQWDALGYVQYLYQALPEDDQVADTTLDEPVFMVHCATGYNDTRGRNGFPEIKAWFERAILLARRDAA